MKSKLKTFLKDTCIFLVITLLSILLVVLVRVFFIATFKIPSHSMEPALYSGDLIVVNKLIPGPRVFTDWNFFQNNNLKMKRYKGIRPLQRGEVVVFNFPKSGGDWHEIKMDFNLYYVKRVVGMPGDTLSIVDGFYRIRNSCEIVGNWRNQFQLSNTSDSILESCILNTFPFNKQYAWTIKNFGPIYIPCANECLKINVANILLYKEIIEYETGEKITVSNNIVFLDDKILRYYRFKQNYYFMAGDQVLNSQDSRYWGLLPEDHIVGEAICILISKDITTGEIRWNRMLKTIK